MISFSTEDFHAHVSGVMADTVNLGSVRNEEELILKHKKERKDLQAHIQRIKHGVPKGDKKKKKEATEEIARLEAELDARQEKELKEFKNDISNESIDAVTEQMKSLETEASNGADDAASDVPAEKQKSKKPSKAQKRREKKQQAEREREERISAAETENLLGERHLESQKIKALVAARGLQVYEINSDGNCLYNAVSHQLGRRDIQSSNESLRRQAADYMRQHPDDFLPFLCQDSEEFEKYCDEVANTAAWGGQLELKALSHVLKTRIEVIQADVPPIHLGEEYEDSPILLIYHRHAFGLGEHYNSVTPKTEEPESDGFS